MIFNLTTSSSCEDEDKELFRELGFRFSSEGYMQSFEPSFQIDTLEELIELQKKVKYPIIIEGNTLEIYNGYRE